MNDPIVWVGNEHAGHFEVDGIRAEVPEHAELFEIQQRLTGRTIVAAGDMWDGDAYWLRLDDGQVVEASGIWHNDSTAGTSIRFWRQSHQGEEPGATHPDLNDPSARA